MARIHNTANTCGDFNLHLKDDGTWTNDQITNALLADIRRELRTLNSTLSCYRVRSAMDAIVRIDRRLQKHMPLKPGRRKAA